MILNNRESNLFCLTCLMLMFTIGLIIIIITYIVFAIIALIRVSLEKQKDLCYDSNLWFYCLISLILIPKINLTIKNIKNNNLILKVIEILITIGIIIWGIYEFYDVNCINNLNDTILYSVTYVYWLSQIIFLGIITIIILYDIIETKTNYEEQINED